MLRAVIFDFDGVITDSEILHYRAFKTVLARYGVDMSQKDYYTTYLGLNDVDCYKLLIEQGMLNAQPNLIRNMLDQKKVIFEELARTEGKIIEGVRDFLQMLGGNAIPMAICSGALSSEIEMILDQARLRHFFEVIVSAEHVRKGKPDPQGFELTLKRLNERRTDRIEPGRCVVIEDSHWGIEAALAAKMPAVAITNTYDAQQLSKADKVIAHLTDLTIDNLHALCK